MEAAFWLGLWTFSPFLYRLSRKSKSEEAVMKQVVFGVERDIDIPAENFPTEHELEEMEGEAVLPHCEHGWYDSVVEVKLHYRKFIPKKPKAVIIYQHGISTHGGNASCVNGRKLNCALLSDVCLKNDIALYAPDMYGHGYSEGTRFLIPETWRNNLQDYLNFCQIVAQEQPNVPVYLMGESYGGTLVLHAAKHYQDSVDSTIKPKAILLTGPAIIGDLPPAPVVYVLRYWLAPYFPKWRPFFMPNPISPERIWRDPQVLKMHTSPRFREMGIDGSGIPFRLGTATNLLEALEEVRRILPSLTVPYCLVHGTDDAGVPMEGSELLWEQAATPEVDREFHRIQGAYHDLLADPCAEEAVGHFMNFVKKQVK